jgi:hypothetical protein
MYKCIYYIYAMILVIILLLAYIVHVYNYNYTCLPKLYMYSLHFRLDSLEFLLNFSHAIQLPGEHVYITVYLDMLGRFVFLNNKSI